MLLVKLLWGRNVFYRETHPFRARRNLRGQLGLSGKSRGPGVRKLSVFMMIKEIKNMEAFSKH